MSAPFAMALGALWGALAAWLFVSAVAWSARRLHSSSPQLRDAPRAFLRSLLFAGLVFAPALFVAKVAVAGSVAGFAVAKSALLSREVRRAG